MWVEPRGDGVEIRTSRCGTLLGYPFTVAEFWEVVEETEEDHLRLLVLDRRQGSPPPH